MNTYMQVTSPKSLNKLAMKIKVVLGLASCSNAQVLIDGDYYVVSMTGNPYFAAAAIVELLTGVKASLKTLRDAINAPPSNAKGDTVRNARDAVDRHLTILAGKVEEVANDPAVPDTKRVEIAHSAGMDVKTQVHPQRHKFTVSNTEISGTVYLTAQGRAKGHEWQYTDDIINFTKRIAEPGTSVANTQISNLKKGTEYAFFHKAILSRQKSAWEGPIILMVL